MCIVRYFFVVLVVKYRFHIHVVGQLSKPPKHPLCPCVLLLGSCVYFKLLFPILCLLFELTITIHPNPAQHPSTPCHCALSKLSPPGRRAGRTGAAVIIDNYADLSTRCQQFVFSNETDHRPPTVPTNSSREFPGGLASNQGTRRKPSEKYFRKF